ncbi:hypothetical protein Q4S57_11470 [Priestia megaterium]|uniref:hypothetical protein n=1 Tax=Priestia megaterium TaxID=1404 RepID=UPI0026E1C267|nr:hypothetical protein [Priestia megaterium]MDO6848572.1 hypothetical protein [Priestia megaterium]
MKEDPNDELRFLIENPSRSDFFIAQVSYIEWLLAVDWRKKRKRREGSAAACGKRSPARESRAVLKVIHTNSFIPFVLL